MSQDSAWAFRGNQSKFLLMISPQEQLLIPPR